MIEFIPTMKKPTFILFIFFLVVSCSDQPRLKPLSADATILAFGDSLTYGTGTSRDKTYPAILEILTRRKVINAGVPGEISKAGLLRLPNLINKYHPKLVIICHGANDILHKLDINQTQDNIQQMITLAKQNNIQVILIAVPEFDLFLNASPIYQILAENNQLVIDKNSLSNIIGDNQLKSDYIHPNTKGYQLLAENISLLLKQAGAITSD